MKPVLPLLLCLFLTTGSATAEEEASARRLPFLAEEARKRGIELPLPFGVGVVLPPG